ncbi:MAG: hypothetical protein II781_00180 [Clostridia bacterium]|nr:hypothetical protein [Clostridia bacterium]
MFGLKKCFTYPSDSDLKSEELLDFALNHVSFYRDHWKKYDIGSGASIDERFAAMPILTKADMRAYFPAGGVPDGKSIEQGLDDDEIEYTFTSGTTGDRVINLWNQPWWHASEMSSWQLNPNLKKLVYPPKQATLASALNIGINCEEDLPFDHRIMGNLLYLNEKANIICWKKSHFVRMAREINEYKPTVLEANPSLLAKLAFWAMDNGVEIYSPDVITFTYELPSRIHLAAIRKVLSSPLVSSYGTTETGFVMDTCEEGRYHQNTDYCRIEYLPLKKEYGGPGIGRLVVSTFGNPWAYMLRFDVGDLVRIHADSSCDCGIGSGFIADTIEGRVSNSTFTADGGLVTTAMTDEMVSHISGVREYDLSQTDPTHYELKLVVPENPKQAVEQAYEELKVLYGNGIFHVESVKELLPGPAGKYRRTHAEFAFDEWSLTEGSYIVTRNE